MSDPAATLKAVRLAVRSLIEDTPELKSQPVLRRHLAERMVDVSLTAAELLSEDQRLSSEIAERARRRTNGAPLAAAQAAGDIHKRTAVNAAPGVLKSTRDAIDFPGFVTSLITGVFQAMTTSSIQQLQAVADLLEAVNTGAGDFANQHVTGDRAMEWAANRFPALTINRSGKEPHLTMRPDGDMPDPAQLKAALDASDSDVSSVDDDNLEETLLPLVRRKLARDRQKMLRTMVLMGLQKIVVDSGRIHASMELQVNARSTAEQTEASRTDTRVSTSGSGSFGMGLWGASASMSATVGYVKSDEQFSREDIALRAGLRSSVDVAFHTEPIALNRMASGPAVQKMKDESMVPDAENKQGSSEDLLATEERKTSKPKFDDLPQMPTAPDPGSEEQRKLREKKDFGPAKEPAPDTTTNAGQTQNPPTDTQTSNANPPPPDATTSNAGGGENVTATP